MGAGVGETYTVGEGLGVGVGEAAGAGIGVTTGFGLATATPLFQTNFLPLLIHVNFFPFETVALPAFLQISPAFTAA
jgi:hypothetical protein